MSISVLVPVYNGASTLRQSLDSVLAQKIPELEVLVIDDGSTDGSQRIILEYAARDPRVIATFNERNLGLSTTLNRALEMATHELVARIDADDESLSDRLETQLRFMKENPGIVAAGSFVYNMGRTPRHDRLVRLPVTPREVARVLPRENCIYHPTVMLRRSQVLKAGGYRAELPHAEDYELWLRLSHRHDLANIPAPLIRYRLSPGGMTLTRPWIQLYYVLLAQELFKAPTVSVTEAGERASIALARIDRSAFLSAVATSNVKELARLGLGPMHYWFFVRPARNCTHAFLHR